MIAYFDTSALVPLFIDEASSVRCGELWEAAERVVTCRIAYVEAAAAIATAERLGRVSVTEAGRALWQLDVLWPLLDRVEINEALTWSAAKAARSHGLRGYDAVHFAAAHELGVHDTLVAVSGDARLLTAWRTVGLATADPNG